MRTSFGESPPQVAYQCVDLLAEVIGVAVVGQDAVGSGTAGVAVALRLETAARLGGVEAAGDGARKAQLEWGLDGDDDVELVGPAGFHEQRGFQHHDAASAGCDLAKALADERMYGRFEASAGAGIVKTRPASAAWSTLPSARSTSSPNRSRTRAAPGSPAR